MGVFHRHARSMLDARSGGGILSLNPGVADLGDELLLAARVDHGVPGDHHITGTDIVFASSADGVRWTVGSRRPIDRSRAIRLLEPLAGRALEREVWRMYDPRLVRIATPHESLVMTAAVDTTHGLRPAILRSDDEGHEWRAVHLGLPDNRNVVVLPDRVGGDWVRLERPMHEYGGDACGAGRYGIWSSRSRDLQRWGDHRFVADAHTLGFGTSKIGPGTPPIRTRDGWLALVHVVDEVDAAAPDPPGPRSWDREWRRRYSMGAILLDLDDPSIVVAVSRQPLLVPETERERVGYRADVVFPTGAVADGDRLRVYYGAADTTIEAADASIDDLLAVLQPVRCAD